jgi:hypothetical protein
LPVGVSVAMHDPTVVYLLIFFCTAAELWPLAFGVISGWTPTSTN